jgi:hypothetical protein
MSAAVGRKRAGFACPAKQNKTDYVREKDFENLAEKFYLCTEEIHFLFYHEGGGFI